MPSEKFFVHKEDGSLVRLKGRLVRFLDEEPPTGSDKSAIRTALEVSPDAEGLVQADIGTDPQNLVLHQHLGSMAYADADSVSVDTLEVTDKVTGTLDVEQSSGTLTTPSSVTTLRVNNSGSASNNAAVAVTSGASGSSFVLLGDNDNDDIGYIKYSNQYNQLQFATAATDRVTIDASGNVKLDGDETELQFNSDTGVGNNVRARIQCEGKTGTYGYGGDLVFKTTQDNNQNFEHLRIASGGQVGINQTSPGSYYSEARDLVVGGSSSVAGATIVTTAGGTGSLFFADGTSGSDPYRGQIRYIHTGDQMMFAVAGNEAFRITSSGDIRMVSGNGIDFGSAAGGTGTPDTTTGGLLDDFETGSFTPSYVSITGSFATMTMQYQVGRYTKVGNIVHFSIFLRTSNVDTTGASNYLAIRGLPFTSASYTSTYLPAVYVGAASGWQSGYAPVGGFIYPNSADIFLVRRTALGSDTGPLDASNVTNGAVANANSIYVAGSYQVA